MSGTPLPFPPPPPPIVHLPGSAEETLTVIKGNGERERERERCTVERCGLKMSPQDLLLLLDLCPCHCLDRHSVYSYISYRVDRGAVSIYLRDVVLYKP